MIFNNLKKVKVPSIVISDKIKSLFVLLKDELENAEITYNIENKEVTIKFKKEL